jgi:hypothetical protein
VPRLFFKREKRSFKRIAFGTDRIVRRGETASKEIDMSVDVKPLEELLKELTPQAYLELHDFAEFLWHKQLTPTASNLGWPAGFFERFAGCLPDLPDIEPEGDYEMRAELT